ncbi:MAG: ABC transporter permease subunit [Alphaproteobacteria bacterium]|jgi:His/Glu/Gln/Arg/opine family amino acid ABC transporter permease subunit|uniref:ABC transporter permease n=1 Tax=Pacificispira sp. TaxID=2888761 RepID=UPI001B09B3A9|nr:ABC transporter permease subunit [Alphaproteobacteria bacterium]MBO6864418.1 ABC transporter permease subunit [Alphaproteobacteria bacterium]MEC9265549.1 ABC transporter permease subunit [Pseudomonadota bacterium]
MEDVWQYRELIFYKGGALTIQVALLSLVLATLFGLLGAWAKLSKNPVARGTAETYTTVIRGIPDLVLMLLVFFQGQIILNRFGEWTGFWDYVEIDPMTAGIGTIGFIMGAYYTETFRGAYLSIPSGQIEAGIACGMSKPLIFRRIIWPQLVRYALPSFTNNWLVQMKTTALVSIIGLQDIVYNANAIGRKLREPFTFLFAALLFFLVLTAISEIALRYLERRYSAGVRRA